MGNETRGDVQSVVDTEKESENEVDTSNTGDIDEPKITDISEATIETGNVDEKQEEDGTETAKDDTNQEENTKIEVEDDGDSTLVDQNNEDEAPVETESVVGAKDDIEKGSTPDNERNNDVGEETDDSESNTE